MVKRLILLLLLPLMTSATLLADNLTPGYDSSTLIREGATLFFRPFYATTGTGSTDSEFQSSDGFLMAGAFAGDKLTWATGNSSAPSVGMYWTLVKAENSDEGVYNVYSPQYKLYLSPAVKNQYVTMVKDQSAAGRYTIKAGTGTYSKSGNTYDVTKYVYFWDVDNGTAFDCNASNKASDKGVKGWTLDGNGYFTAVEPTVDIANATEASYWADLNDKLIYLTPNQNQSNFTNSSIKYITMASLTDFASKAYPYGVNMNNGKRCMWRMISVDGLYATYYIQNVATGYYIGIPADIGTSLVSMVDKIENAGQYTALKSINETDAKGSIDKPIRFLCQNYSDKSKTCYLETKTSSPFGVGTWSAGGVNAYYELSEVPEETLNGTLHMKNDIKEGEPQFLTNAQGQNYLTLTSTSAVALVLEMRTSPVGWDSGWVFTSTGATDSEGRTIYNIQNIQRELYLGPTSKTASGVAIGYVEEAKEAGKYVVVDPHTGEDYCGFYDVDNPTYGYLNISGSTLVNAGGFDYGFKPVASKNTASNYVSPGTDLILSPLSIGVEGFTNLYSDFNTIKCETVDATWQGVWQLTAAAGYPRYIDVANLVHLKKDETTTVTENADGTTTETTTYTDYDATDYPTMAYSLYNRDEMLYMMIDPDSGKLTTTSEADKATCFKIEINGDDDEAGSGVGNLARFVVVSNGGSGIDYKPTGQYLKYNGTELVASETASYKDDSSFYLRAAFNTSFDACTDGAKITLYPSALQLWNKRMYVKLNSNEIYREAKDDPVDHGALTVWTLIQCKASDKRATSQYNNYKDEQLKDVYYVYNEATNRYMGPLIGKSNGNTVYPVEGQENAGRFKFMGHRSSMARLLAFDVDYDLGDNGLVETGSSKFINVSALSNGYAYQLVAYTYGGSNSSFYTSNPVKYDSPATSYIVDGAYITMMPWDYKGDPNNSSTTTGSSKYNEKGGYVYQSTSGSVECATTETLDENKVNSLYYTWKIVAAKDESGEVIPDVYYLVNAATGAYMPSTAADKTGLSIVPGTDGTVPEGAGRFTPVLDTDTGLYVAFRDYDTLGNSNYGYIGNDVTESGEKSMNSRTLGASADLSQYSTEERETEVYNPELGDTQTMKVKYHNYANTQFWYYINPVDISTSLLIDEDYLKWVIENLDTKGGRTVGHFDALENTEYKSAYIVTTGDDGQPQLTPIDKDDPNLDSDGTRKLTFEELAELVKYNYENQSSYNDEQKKAADAALQELKRCIEDEEYIIHPRIGRFYTITSPYRFYKDLYLRETYTAKYYNEMQAQQQVHFMHEDNDEEEVSTFWRFDIAPDEADKSLYTDKNVQHYFYIRAVNSRDVLRRLNTTIVADSREDSNLEAGLFALNKDYNLNVYYGSTLLRSYNKNKERTWADEGSFLGIWTPEGTENPMDAVVRAGSDARIPQVNENVRPEGAVNNWNITEVKEVHVNFLDSSNNYSTPDDEPNNNKNQFYYNAFCYPFSVKIPAGQGLKAYTAVDGTTSDKTLSFKKADNEVIPAFCPFVLESTTGLTEASLEIVYGAGEEYGLYDKRDRYTDANWAKICEEYGIALTQDEYDAAVAANTDLWSMTSINSLVPTGDEKDMDNTQISQSRYSKANGATVVGNICPSPLGSGEQAYVLHDDCDNVATLVTEGKDKSYETADDALYTSTSTYVIPCNSAVLILESDEDQYRVDDPITSGVEEVSTEEVVREPERDANGNLIYFDLYGRRITNPAPGIYILTNGRKVVVR